MSVWGQPQFKIHLPGLLRSNVGRDPVIESMNSTPPPLVTAAPVASAQPLEGVPMLRLGFRPFYLGAAAFAALSIPLWVAIVLGQIALPMTMPPLLWHAHEMLFGFAAAVIVGFLLTAGKAWTGLATPRGAGLAALALLWLAARAAALVAPYPLYAALDMLLLPLVAGLLTAVLLRAGNRRNLPLAGILLLLAGANAIFHLASLGLVDVAPMTALHARIDRVRIDGRDILHDIDLTLPRGRWTAIVGPNGAGKSTLLRAIAGLQRCDGAVQLDGRPLQAWPARERAQRLAWMGQHESGADDLMPRTSCNSAACRTAPGWHHRPRQTWPPCRPPCGRHRAGPGGRGAWARCRAVSASACCWRGRWPSTHRSR